MFLSYDKIIDNISLSFDTSNPNLHKHEKYDHFLMLLATKEWNLSILLFFYL